MTSSKRNKTIFIDQEAASALELLDAGLLYPVTKLMNKQESDEVSKTGMIDGKTFPFPFILAPAGKRNEAVLKTLRQGDAVTLVCEDESFATLTVEEVFEIDPQERLLQIYGTTDIMHPGIQATLKRLGRYAIAGTFHLQKNSAQQGKQIIEKAKKLIDAKHVSALVMAANPLHRAHERLIRQTLDTTDLVVIFLLRPYNEKNLEYSLRYETLKYFLENFLPKNKAVIVPLENSYIFAGYNEIILDAIVAKNHGCDKLVIGRNHAGLGMFYDCNSNKSIIDRLVGIDIEIEIASEYVYCDKCRTLVSTNTCPHGQHHHISYKADSIRELLELGILPPAVLMRKELSSYILSKLYPNRFKNLEKLYYDVLPVGGLLQEHTEQDFYMELMKLYQTTSLT